MPRIAAMSSFPVAVTHHISVLVVLMMFVGKLCLFSVNDDGEPTAIYWSNNVRGSHFPVALIHRIREWYEAYYAFEHLMRHPDFKIEFQLQPGQMMLMDNYRVLHGRSSFEIKENQYRYCELAYFDWDEMRSKARVIMRNQEKSKDGH